MTDRSSLTNMADNLPNLMVLRVNSTSRYVAFVKGNDGRIRSNEESVFSHLAKIQVEAAKSDSRYVHLRFTHTNKYWGRRPNATFITATSDQPVDDLSDPACTLFQPEVLDVTGPYSFRHLQSRSLVGIDQSNHLVALSEHIVSGFFLFLFVDWDTLVKLPTHLSFKGDNDRYLKGVRVNNTPFLQLSSTDPNEGEASYEVETTNDGHVRIRSLHFDRLWRRNATWIWVDAFNHNFNADTLFWPVKIDDDTIALRNAGNNRFIRRMTSGGFVNLLSADVDNITLEARLELKQLVLRRDIYNVRYRMEDARIYDEQPFVAGLATATNLTKDESSLAVTVAFEDSFSYSFSNSLSITHGVATSISAGIPKIAGVNIEVSTEINTTFEWDKTTTETKTVTAEHTVTVPPMSRARLSCVGTQGKCSVPFNYTQRDKRSVNGDMVVSKEVDGIYNGVNYFNFQFEVLETEAL